MEAPRTTGPTSRTHPTFAELVGDAVVGDGLADQDGDIVPPLGLLLITIDVTRYGSEPDPNA